jgi:hypothetical protein
MQSHVALGDINCAVKSEVVDPPPRGDVHMISLVDCIALCGLSEAEVSAIAEHEHVPEIVAAGLAQYLLKRDRGPDVIRDMIVDDVRNARARGDFDHARTTLHVLHHFLREHPEVRPRGLS